MRGGKMSYAIAIEFPGSNGWSASRGQCTVTNSMDQRHRTVRCLNTDPKDPDKSHDDVSLFYTPVSGDPKFIWGFAHDPTSESILIYNCASVPDETVQYAACGYLTPSNTTKYTPFPDLFSITSSTASTKLNGNPLMK